MVYCHIVIRVVTQCNLCRDKPNHLHKGSLLSDFKTPAAACMVVEQRIYELMSDHEFSTVLLALSENFAHLLRTTGLIFKHDSTHFFGLLKGCVTDLKSF